MTFAQNSVNIGDIIDYISLSHHGIEQKQLIGIQDWRSACSPGLAHRNHVSLTFITKYGPHINALLIDVYSYEL